MKRNGLLLFVGLLSLLVLSSVTFAEMVISGDKVGIGTETPSSALEVHDTTGIAIRGFSTSSAGVYGYSSSNSGVVGYSSSSDGVGGYSVSGAGVYGSSVNGWAAYFEGPVNLTGNQTVSGNVTVGGSVTAASFSGNGAALTNLNGANITGGSVAPANIGFLSKVAIVATSGGDYDNPATAMSDYASWCGTPSDTNPCLLKIMPGVYDISTSSVVMQPYIDIEGSGENVTVIQGNVDSLSSGVVEGANNSEIRFLTVKNTGGGNFAVAIFNNSASPKLTNVTVTASGASITHMAVSNNNSSSPRMSNVTASASGGSQTHGVYNSFSSPTMVNVTATASGGTNINVGVNNQSASPTMVNVTATGSGSSSTCYGVYNNTSSPTITNLTATASGGSSNRGVFNYTSGTVRINHSVIKGSTNTISNGSGVTTYVGNTQLDGGAVSNSGTLSCAGVYDENYTFYASTCP